MGSGISRRQRIVVSRDLPVVDALLRCYDGSMAWKLWEERRHRVRDRDGQGIFSGSGTSVSRYLNQTSRTLLPCLMMGTNGYEFMEE